MPAKKTPIIDLHTAALMCGLSIAQEEQSSPSLEVTMQRARLAALCATAFRRGAAFRPGGEDSDLLVALRELLAAHVLPEDLRRVPDKVITAHDRALRLVAQLSSSTRAEDIAARDLGGDTEEPPCPDDPDGLHSIGCGCDDREEP